MFDMHAKMGVGMLIAMVSVGCAHHPQSTDLSIDATRQVTLKDLAQVIGAYENILITRHALESGYVATESLAAKSESDAARDPLTPRAPDMVIAADGRVEWTIGVMVTDIDAPPGTNWWDEWKKTARCVVRHGELYHVDGAESAPPLFVAFKTPEFGLLLVPGDEVANFQKVAAAPGGHHINAFLPFRARQREQAPPIRGERRALPLSSLEQKIGKGK